MNASSSDAATTAAVDRYLNINSPPNLGFFMILTMAICLACATPMVWTRMYVHVFVTKLPKWDDGLVYASWIGLVAYCTGLLISINYGFLAGVQDVANTDPANNMKWKLIIWIMEIAYTFMMMFAKVPVLILYKRIFNPDRGGKTWVYYTVVTFAVFNAVYYLVNLVAAVLQCIPTNRIWDISVPGHCLNIYILFIGTAIVNVLSDAFMIIIPVVVILKLQMPGRRKIEVLFVFAFGIICVISAIFRLVYSVTGAKDSDQNAALIKVALWTIAEITACTTAACVPMVPLMVKHIRSGMTRSTPSQDQSVQAQQPRKPKKSVFGLSWLGTTLADNSDDDKDPYLLVDNPSVRTVSSGTTRRSISGASSTKDVEIVVSTTIDITSVPKSYFDKSIV